MNIEISGNLCGPTAVFIAGWPDTCDVFRDNIMAALAADYRIVGITLPGYDDDHPFLKSLRQRGSSSSASLGGTGAEPARNQEQSGHTGGQSWLPRVFPFSRLGSRGAEKSVEAARSACAVNALRMEHGLPPLELFKTNWKGHSLQDLATMLEIAVDTAMETCNYCPAAFPAAAPARERRASAGSPSQAHAAAAASLRGEGRAEAVGEVPAHQLPPTYVRPVLIAHDWGCLLAYELLLMRPNLFSRFVSLDLGVTVFEHCAPHVERMCGLVEQAERQRAMAVPAEAGGPKRDARTALFDGADLTGLAHSFSRDKAPSQEMSGAAAKGSKDALRGRQPPPSLQGNAHDVRRQSPSKSASPTLHASSPTSFPGSQPQQQQQQGNTTPSSPVTVVHGVVPGGGSVGSSVPAGMHEHASFGAPPGSVSNASQLRSSISGAATKRSLASQYAIRRKKPTMRTWRTEARKAIAMATYQVFLIVCHLLVPSRLARWLVGCLASIACRVPYCYDPQVAPTPTVELLNHSINAQFFAQHPYAVENRGAFDLPVLLRLQDSSGAGGMGGNDASFPSINLEHPSLMHDRYGAAQQSRLPTRLLPGWKILLVAFVEGKPLQQAKVPRRVGSHAAEPQETTSPLGLRERQRRDYDDGSGSALSGRGYGGSPTNPLRTPTQSDPCGTYRLQQTFSTSTDMSAEDVNSPLLPPGWRGGDAFAESSGEAPASQDSSHVIYSSYTKGAGLFEQWNSSVEGYGRVGASVGACGELDPYRSSLAIPRPLWAAEDPLALTGAQSFHESRRRGTYDKDELLMVAPDTDASARRGSAAAQSAAATMQVAKRKIYYQAVAFPPLAPPGEVANGSLASADHNAALSDDASSTRSTRSTVLGRLRRAQRKAALRPTVPVVASPRQGWIYVRWWLGLLLGCFMAFVSWLLGEKKTQHTSATADGGGGAGGGSGGAAATAAGTGKAYSNVMTTAMTTIYRRLPATPSLASSTANLPGDGEVVLQPMSYAPLVTQRYFVPLPVPILFMYGGNKSFMLHADHWCAYVRQYQRRRDGISDVVEVQGGGHWFFAEKKYQKKVADRIAEFLAAEPRASPGV